MARHPFITLARIRAEVIRLIGTIGRASIQAAVLTCHDAAGGTVAAPLGKGVTDEVARL